MDHLQYETLQVAFDYGESLSQHALFISLLCMGTYCTNGFWANIPFNICLGISYEFISFRVCAFLF